MARDRDLSWHEPVATYVGEKRLRSTECGVGVTRLSGDRPGFEQALQGVSERVREGGRAGLDAVVVEPPRVPLSFNRPIEIGTGDALELRVGPNRAVLQQRPRGPRVARVRESQGRVASPAAV